MNSSVECDLLIVNACILSMDDQRSIYPSGAVAIAGREIAMVGPEAMVTKSYHAKRMIDAKGGIVHPGLIDSHVHLMHTARGALPDNTPWKQGMLFYTRWRDLLDEEEDHAGCLLSCIEMIRNGVTCFMEAGTVLFPNAAAAAAEAVGMRGFLADTILWDVGAISSEATIRRAPIDRDRCLKQLGGQLWRNKDPNALVRGHIALYGDGTASEELMKAGKAKADEAGVIFAQHQSFASSDWEIDTQRFGKSPFLHYAEIDLLGENCTFTHCNVLDHDEMRLIAESRMSIVWCPSSTMVWGNGGTMHGRHLELFRHGVNIALGSDSANSCGRFDPSWQACLAVMTAREKTRDGNALAFENGLEFATLGGAKAVGMERRIGTLQAGRFADIVIHTPSIPEALTGIDPVRSVIFSAGSKSVDTVIVDGRIVLRNGKSTLLDEETIYAKARESTIRMSQRINLPTVPRWPRVT